MVRLKQMGGHESVLNPALLPDRKSLKGYLSSAYTYVPKKNNAKILCSHQKSSSTHVILY